MASGRVASSGTGDPGAAGEDDPVAPLSPCPLGVRVRRRGEEPGGEDGVEEAGPVEGPAGALSIST